MVTKLLKILSEFKRNNLVNEKYGQNLKRETLVKNNSLNSYSISINWDGVTNRDLI